MQNSPNTTAKQLRAAHKAKRAQEIAEQLRRNAEIRAQAMQGGR